MRNFLLKPFFEVYQLFLIMLILLIALVGFISMDIYFPSLPAITKAFSITHGDAQLTLTLFLFGFGFSQLFYGPLSDYFGRRPILLIGFFIYLIGSLFLLISHHTATLLIARLIQGIGAGAGASLCRVLLRDNFIGDKMAKITSYLTVGIGLAAALSPAAGGFIQDKIGFQGNFEIMLFFGAFTWMLIFLYLPETNKSLSDNALHPNTILKTYSHLLNNKFFIGNMICSGLAFSGLIAFAIINPFIIQNNLRLSPTVYGAITLVIASGEILGTYINGLIVERIGYSKMLLVGIGLMLLSSIYLLTMTGLNIVTLTSITTSCLLVTMSIGITIPNATTGAFSSIKNSIGTAGAIYGFFQILITVLITFIISCIKLQGQFELGLIFLLLSLSSLVIYSFILRNNHNQFS